MKNITIPDFEVIKPRPIVLAAIGEKRCHVTMEDNSSARAFVDKLSKSGRQAVDLRDYANPENADELPWKLEKNAGLKKALEDGVETAEFFVEWTE